MFSILIQFCLLDLTVKIADPETTGAEAKKETETQAGDDNDETI